MHEKEAPKSDNSQAPVQRYVPVVLGRVYVADRVPHAHRFATVSSEAILLPNGDHVHRVKFFTDFYDGHYHEFCGNSSGAIKVGDRHVHFAKAATSFDAGHSHKFRVAALIDNPTDK